MTPPTTPLSARLGVAAFGCGVVAGWPAGWSVSANMLGAAVERRSWDYWIDGAGQWVNRLHCTSHDYLLMVLTISTTLWMAFHYLVFAVRCHQGQKLVGSDSVGSEHLARLSNVFLQCVSIHLLSSVVMWFWTPYYAVAGMMLANGYQTMRLNNSKLTAMHYRQLAKEIREGKALEKIRRLVDEKLAAQKFEEQRVDAVELQEFVKRLTRELQGSAK